MTRRPARDLIVSISSTFGWQYPKARLVTDSEGNAAVFVPPRGSGPVRTFRFADGIGAISAIRGTKVETDDGAVTYRRIGSSCGWPLAKCNVKTATLMAAWPEQQPQLEPVGYDDDPTEQQPEPSLAEKREWAKANGYEVKDRGALPKVVLAAYDEAHGG